MLSVILVAVAGLAVLAVIQHGPTRRSRVPVVLEEFDEDEGATCLLMALRCLRLRSSIQEVRAALARHRGVEPHELRFLDPGDILHWDDTRFFVFESLRDGWVTVIDPAQGRPRLDLDEAAHRFSRKALILARRERYGSDGSRTRKA